jgi:DUF917 family protein
LCQTISQVGEEGFLSKSQETNGDENDETRTSGSGFWTEDFASKGGKMKGGKFLSFILCAALLTGGSLRGQENPKIRTLSEEEICDLMVGSSIQATRGNNSDGMVKRVRAALAERKKFTLISVNDLPDDWTVVAVCGVGGGTPWEYVTERVKKQGLATTPDTALRAVELLSRHIGKKFDAVVRNEPAGSTIVAFMTAAALEIPVVDACLSGRARPEVQQQIPFVFGIPGTPAALFTSWGDTIILEKTVDDYRIEDLSRAVAIASGGAVWMAQNPMSGKDTKRGVIPDNLSQAILFGRTIREARERQEDPIAALVKASKGYMLFHGIVTKSEHRGERGFHWGDAELKGIAEHEGHTYKIFIKNENIMSWFDGHPDVMPPDYICNLDPKTGDAVKSWGAKGYPLGEEVVIVGMPASSMWRTPKGIEVMGPRHFGFDLDYVPLEELQKIRKKYEHN